MLSTALALLPLCGTCVSTLNGRENEYASGGLDNAPLIPGGKQNGGELYFFFAEPAVCVSSQGHRSYLGSI